MHQLAHVYKILFSLGTDHQPSATHSVHAHGVSPPVKRFYTLRLGLFLLIATLFCNRQPWAADNAQQQFPDVLAAEVHSRGNNQFDFDVTVSSPYDTPQRYADAIHATSKDGTVLGERMLLHDHGDEQPFTRDLYGVVIAPEIHEVVIQARDKHYGYGGKTVTVRLPGR